MLKKSLFLDKEINKKMEKVNIMFAVGRRDDKTKLLSKSDFAIDRISVDNQVNPNSTGGGGGVFDRPVFVAIVIV